MIRLLEEGFPVPFIARYRKDQTGNLDETQIREVELRLNELRQLAERKQVILKAIESLGKMTPELDQKIREARTSKRLEDLYLPYKPKRETLASAAKSRGLEPLALEILEGKLNQEKLGDRVKDFIDADKGVKTEADALLGAGHVIGEMFSEKVELRQKIRDLIQRTSQLVTKRIEQEQPEDASKTIETAVPERISPIVVTESAQTFAATSIAAKFNLSDIDEAVPFIEEVAVSQLPAEAIVATDTSSATEISESGIHCMDGDVAVNAAHEAAAAQDQVVVPKVVISEIDESEITVATTFAPPAPEETFTQTTETVMEPLSVVTQDTVAETVAESEIAIGNVTLKNTQETVVPPAIATAKAVKADKKKKKKKAKTPQEEKRLAELDKLYNDYFDFSSEFRKMMPYRVLAINRGEKARVLRVRFDHDKDAIQAIVNDFCIPNDHPLSGFLAECAKDALTRLLLPALEREARRDLTESAEQQAVNVFAKNLRNLLLQPPLNRQRVLAIDPGLRHGCKTVALDEFGNVLVYDTVYLVGKAGKKGGADEIVAQLVEQYNLTVIAIGNGTGCREAEDFVLKLIAGPLAGKDIGYIIVNESGASVYSTSPAAKEEFPNYDVMLRGAVSIGRRLQDPLNELVKIEPGHIGIGMYQHDVKVKHLQESLEKVVESCVNHVGVDLNRATPAILRYVAGLNQLTAKRVYEYRRQNGPFRTREQLKQVTGLGEVSYTHAAGFLKIRDGSNPFDATWIHPESYDVAAKILRKFGFEDDDLRSSDKIAQIAEALKTADIAELAQELGIGQMTVADIIAQLGRPGRDPREELPAPIFKKGVLHLDDLEAGAELTGTVLNVVDFGAFVDIGLHESGLVHISHMADRFVKDAHQLVAVGDVVKVWVVDIDRQRNRISLTMLPPGTERKPEKREDRRRPRGEGQAPRDGDRPKRDPQRGDRQGARRDGDGRTGDVGQRQEGRRQDRQGPAGPRQDGQHRDAGPREGASGDSVRQAVGADDRNKRRDDHGRRRDDHDRRRDDRKGDRRDGRRAEGGSRRRDGDGRKTDRYNRPKSFEILSKQEKVISPLSESMKKGSEPLRSFSDLAQFLGHLQPVDPEEEKRRKKQEKLAKKREAEDAKSGTQFDEGERSDGRPPH
ncbi:MAG: helix-hairpin-helix domain-containing protein [Planctomycetaceae bacterium]|nr:helix-hairpin-helix domain-containing protein [Planctomycetaceae bacterium]